MALSATDIAAELGGWSPDPKTWDPIFAEASKTYKVPERILRSLIMQESSNKVDSYGEHVPGQGRAEGLGQFMPKTSAGAGISPWNPKEVIPQVAKMLAEGYKKNQSWDYALKTYFGGPDESAWGPKTAAYPGQVAKRYKDFGWDPAEIGLGAGGVSAAPAGAFTAPAPPPVATAGGLTPEDIVKELQAGRPAPAPPVVPKFTVPTGPQPAEWGLDKALLNGATLGFLPDIMGGITALRGKLGMNVGSPEETVASEKAGRDQYTIDSPLASLVGELGGSLPTTLSGIRAVRAVGGLVPAGLEAVGLSGLARQAERMGNFLGGSTLASAPKTPMGMVPQFVARGASRAASGAWEGGLSGAMLSQMGEGSLEDQAKLGSMVGAVLNPALSVVTGPLERALNAKVAPRLNEVLASPEAAAVNLRPTQVAQGVMPKTLDKMVSDSANTAQAELFAERLAKKLGLPNREISPENIRAGLAANGRKLGDALDAVGQIDVTAPVKVKFGPWKIDAPDMFGAVDQLRNIVNGMTYVERAKMEPVMHMLDRLDTTMLTHLRGAEYQELTGHLGAIWRLMQNPDADIKGVGVLAKEILDTGLEHTAKAAGKPEIIKQVKEARQAYRALTAMESLPDLIKNQSGVLSPAKLSTSVLGAFDKPESLGDIHTLLQAGQYLPGVTAAGDTAKGLTNWDIRNLTHYIPQLVTGSVAGLGAHAAGGGGIAPWLTGLGTAAGLQLGRNRMTAVLGNPAYRNKIVEMNQGLNPGISFNNWLVPPAVGIANVETSPARRKK